MVGEVADVCELGSDFFGGLEVALFVAGKDVERGGVVVGGAVGESEDAPML